MSAAAIAKNGQNVLGANIIETDSPVQEKKVVDAVKGASSCETAPGSADTPPKKKTKKEQNTAFRKQVILSMSRVCQLFAPYIHLIRVKKADEEEQARAAMAFKRWADGTDTESFEDMAAHGAKLEEELQKAAHVRIAFADKGEHQSRFVNAADYADEWAEDFKAWYICHAGQAAGWGNCNTLIQSKLWETLHDDPMATGQRWYCRNCGGKYKTRYGVLIEWKLQGIAHYLLAELPPPHLLDVKGMIIEARFGENCGTAAELFELIPTMEPASTRYFKARTGTGGMTYQLSWAPGAQNT